MLLAALETRAAVPFGNGACSPAGSAARAAADPAGASDEGTGAALGPLLPKPGGGTGFAVVAGCSSLPWPLATPGAASALGANAAAVAGSFCPFWRCRLLPVSATPAWAVEPEDGRVECQLTRKRCLRSNSSLAHKCLALLLRAGFHGPPALLTTAEGAATDADATSSSSLAGTAPVAPAVGSVLGSGTGCCPEADALRGTVRTFVCLAALGGVGALAEAVSEPGTARGAGVRRAELAGTAVVVTLTLPRSPRAARAAAAAAAAG